MAHHRHKIYVIGGGTVFHIAPHLAISAPAYGKVAREIAEYLLEDPELKDGEVHLHLTRMAGDEHLAWQVSDGKDGKFQGIQQIVPSPIDEDDDQSRHLETNADIAKLLDELCADPDPKVIFLPAALCDFKPVSVTSSGSGDGMSTQFGKDQPRWKTGETYSMGRGEEYPMRHELTLMDSEKIINRIRKERKDIFLVGFKTTAGETPHKQFEAGLKLLKKASCNLVLANDIKTKMNMVITPEQAPYEPSTNREEVLRTLVGMALARSRGHFTRSVVAEGKPIDWNSNVVPASLRTVVNYCIKKGAYKPFLGATVGHFAFKVADNKFVTSRRKTNFNELDKVGMVLVEAIDDNRVIAYGSRPSVGGQSQRIIFKEHPDVDCIVHFHCPMKKDSRVPVKPQWLHECGSHECGQNTSDGLEYFELGRFNHNVSKLVGRGPMIKAVMLDKHGPNIVFHHEVDPNEVIRFIEDNWDLSRSTSELDL